MAPAALAASAPCSTCGFLLLLAGSLRTEFGVCANEWSPDDGRVVSMDHGCGAHSETNVSTVPSDWPDPVRAEDPLDTDPLPDEPETVAVEPSQVAQAPANESGEESGAEPAADESVAEEPAAGEPADESVAEEPAAE